MRILLHSTGGNCGRRFLDPAWSGIDLCFVEQVQEFSSLLYRDPDSSGILHCHRPDQAGEIVRGMRQGEVKNRLVVTLDGRFLDDAAQASARAAALRAGADDAQPSSIDERELVARLRAIANRGDYFDFLRVELPGCVFRYRHRAFVTNRGRFIHLSEKLCQLFIEFVRKPDQVLSKQDIMDALYGDEVEPAQRIVDVYICKLRQRIMEATGGLDCIRTNWGRGWHFVQDGFIPDKEDRGRRDAARIAVGSRRRVA